MVVNFFYYTSLWCTQIRKTGARDGAGGAGKAPALDKSWSHHISGNMYHSFGKVDDG